MDHSQIPKKAYKCSVWAVEAFRMYGGIGMSASSLHRESTDSLIQCIYIYVHVHVYAMFVIMYIHVQILSH